MNEGSAEELSRHKVLGLLRRRGLLSEERIELQPSWRRRGVSLHKLKARDGEGTRDGARFEEGPA